MNRLMSVLGAACLMVASTGCLHHNLRGNCGSGCESAASCGTCETGGCQTGNCGSCETESCGTGILNRLRNGGSCGNACGNSCGSCSGGCRTGCVAGGLGWQQGGLDYSSHLKPGLLGHGAGARLNSTPFTPGPPSAQVGYPYYSVRGPRDFFLDNPPTIGR